MRQIYIEDAAKQLRVYVVERDQLVEFHRQREDEQQTMGSIYLARVQRILPGIQAAFVDAGLGQNCFLPAAEMGGDASLPLQKRLKGGTLLPVQVQRAPGGEKGLRVSAKIHIAGRLLVLMPGQDGVNISKRIRNQAKRDALTSLLEGALPDAMGLVVRSNAAQAPEEDLLQEIAALIDQWQGILIKAATQSAPGLLWQEQGLLGRVMTDLVIQDHTMLHVSGDAALAALRTLAQQLCPAMLDSIFALSPEQAQQQLSSIDQTMEKLTQRRVWLKSGGTLVVDKTEALWVLDVNTAKFVGSKQNGGELLMRTNEEAVDEAARQLRLRDMEGMILIDLIHLPAQQQQVLVSRMRDAARADRGQINVHGFSAMGLLELTRRRAHRQAPDAPDVPCPYCNGTGAIAAPGEAVQQAMLKAWRILRVQPGAKLKLTLHPSEVAGAQKALQGGVLAGLSGAVALQPGAKHRTYYQVDAAADEQMEGLEVFTLA